MNDNKPSRANLPEGLLDKLGAAIEAPQNELKKALRLLLESANVDLQSQVATILTPVDDDALRFHESTEDVFTTPNFPTIPIGSSIAGFVYLSGQSMGMDDARESARFYAEIDDRSGFQTKEYLATPIIMGANVLGVLTFANRVKTIDNPMFSGKEITLADDYASICAVLLDHASHLRRLTGSTLNTLQHTIRSQESLAEMPDGLWKSSEFDLRKDEIYAQLSEVLNELSERDLEILRDLAERLSLLAHEEK